MTRADQPGRAPLPGADIPSAEVLDELLRAFSVDVTDRQRLAQVDLSSPEVAELLTPAEGPAAPEAPQPPQPNEPNEPAGASEDASKSEPQPEVETSSEPEVQGAAEVQPEPGGDVEVDASPAGRTIVIDSADDPPDAVYLAAGDPLLRPAGGAPGVATAADAAPGGDGPIFIDDRPTGETISLEAATSATRIEPRLRERRIAVRRAEGRTRLRWAFVVAIVVAVVVAGLAVLGSSLFTIEDVEVEGVVYTDEAALDAVVEDLRGTPVLRADTEQAERALEEIPWVEVARVTTDFPHGAKIEIRERAPVVTFEGPDGAFRVIDTHGRVLDVLDAEPVEYLLVMSADAPALTAGQFAPQGFAAAASLVQALTPELRARAQSVAVTADGSDLRLMLTDGIEARFGAARDLVVKLVRLQTSLDDLESGAISYVDVSTNEVTTG